MNESLPEQELILTWSHFSAHFFPHAAESSLNSFLLQAGNGNYLKSLCCGQGLLRTTLSFETGQRCPWTLLQAERLLPDQNRNRVPAVLNRLQRAGFTSAVRQWLLGRNQSLGAHLDISAKWQRSAVYVTSVSSNSCHKFMWGLICWLSQLCEIDFYIHALLPEGALYELLLII